MICKNCGAILPDDAEFCGECGTKIQKPKKDNASFAKAKNEAKRYKIISIILACLCIALGIGWITSTNDPYKNIDSYEEEALDIDRAGVELTGVYIVGEDSELPEGRYNIYPPEGESYMDVDIYANEADAKKKYDKDYNSLAITHVYSLTRGLKLKAGQVVVIEYDSAFFELASDSTEEAEEETQAETEGTAEEETGAEE